MKSKKKLLVAMAAMSVAAIGAGTVSTFAWYTANGAAQVGKGQTLAPSATVTAQDANLSTNASYYIRFEAEEMTNKTLYLSENVGGTLVTYFVDAQGYAVAANATDFALGSDRVLSKLYKVSATLTTRTGEEPSYTYTPITLTDPQELAALHAVNQNVTATATASAVDAGLNLNPGEDSDFIDDGEVAPQSHPTHLAAAESNTVEGSYIADTMNSTSNEVSFTVNPSTFASSAWDGSKTIVGYFLLRIDGNSSATTVGSSAMHTNGNVTATITLA